MKLRRQGVVTAIITCMLPLAASCKSAPYVVLLPSGYAGPVSIQCKATSTSAPTITVNAQGQANADFCPVHPTDLNIMRDGKQVQPSEAPTWETTGDNIPVDLHFVVR